MDGPSGVNRPQNQADHSDQTAALQRQMLHGGGPGSHLRLNDLRLSSPTTAQPENTNRNPNRPLQIDIPSLQKRLADEAVLQLSPRPELIAIYDLRGEGSSCLQFGVKVIVGETTTKELFQLRHSQDVRGEISIFRHQFPRGGSVEEAGFGIEGRCNPENLVPALLSLFPGFVGKIQLVPPISSGGPRAIPWTPGW